MCSRVPALFEACLCWTIDVCARCLLNNPLSFQRILYALGHNLIATNHLPEHSLAQLANLPSRLCRIGTAGESDELLHDGPSALFWCTHKICSVLSSENGGARGESNPPALVPIFNRCFPQSRVLSPPSVETSPGRPASAKVPANRHMRTIVLIIVLTSSLIIVNDNEMKDLISTERPHTPLRITP